MANNFKANTRPVNSTTADQSTTSMTPVGQTVYLKHIKENLLDSVDLPSCLWSLYMISEDAFLNNKDLNNVKLSSSARKVLIAASGRTDEFTMSNVVIDSKIGILPGVNTNVTFDITTPYSSDLIDKLLTSAAFLGLNNYSKSPMMMQLDIKGRSPKTGLSTHLATRSFAVFIKSMSFSVNEEGARYSVDAASVNDLPRGDVAENLNEQISIEGTNPQELLKDLSDKLLEREDGAISVRKDLADQYEFVFEDNAQQIATEVIKSDAFVAPNTSSPKNKEKEEKVTATEKTNHVPNEKVKVDYEKGMGISSIIENIITNSPVLKKKVTEYEEKNKKFAEKLKADGKATSVKKANIKQFYNFDTQVTYLGYDYLRRDYAKKFEYRISMYDTPFGYVAQTDISTDKKQNVDRINEIQDRVGIKKLYHYMYTGMNDQILDMSYNFDNMFYVAIGAQSEVIDSFKFLPGVRYDESLRKTLDEARIASNNLKLYNQMSKLGTSDDDKRTRARLEAQIIANDPTLREQVRANEYNMSPNATTNLITRRVEAYEAAVVRGGTALRENQNPDPVGSNVDVYNVPGAVATENEKELSNTNEGQTLTKRLNNSNVRSAVSDIQALGSRNPGTGSNTVFAGDMTRQAFADYYKDKPLPPMFYETGKVTQTGVEGDTTPGGGLLAQYFNNAKNVGSTGDMMNVEMTIKGDLTFLPDLSRNNSKNRDVVTRKPLMIIVTSNQVSEYNKNGFMRVNTKNALNGLYMVIEANHKWTDEGQYIITLGLRRELGTDLHGLAFRSQMQNYEY